MFKALLIFAALSLAGCAGCIPWFVPDEIPVSISQTRAGLSCTF